MWGKAVSIGMGELFGRHYHSIDSKGRLAIPASVLAAVGRPFYISVSEDKCLNIYSRDEWLRLAAERFSPLSEEQARELRRRFYSAAQIYETTDKQGRIVLTATHREYADLNELRGVVIAGAGTYAEIWDKARWDGLGI
jgi:MraZ protein